MIDAFRNVLLLRRLSVSSSLLVVGAGLAGLGAARAARRSGFAGSVTVVGAETHRPYDRPPLSKDYLLGTVGVADVGLEGTAEDLGVDWRLGTVAPRSTRRTDDSPWPTARSSRRTPWCWPRAPRLGDCPAWRGRTC